MPIVCGRYRHMLFLRKVRAATKWDVYEDVYLIYLPTLGEISSTFPNKHKHRHTTVRTNENVVRKESKLKCCAQGKYKQSRSTNQQRQQPSSSAWERGEDQEQIMHAAINDYRNDYKAHTANQLPFLLIRIGRIISLFEVCLILLALS